jgi:hypothetical protein
MSIIKLSGMHVLFKSCSTTPLRFYATRVSKLSQTKRAQNEYDSNTRRSDNSDNQGSADERLTDNGHVDKQVYLTDEKSQNEYLEDDLTLEIDLHLRQARYTEEARS